MAEDLRKRRLDAPLISGRHLPPAFWSQKERPQQGQMGRGGATEQPAAHNNHNHD